MGDLLGRTGDAIELHSLYRCLDKLLDHKPGQFSFLTGLWTAEARVAAFGPGVFAIAFHCSAVRPSWRTKQPGCVATLLMTCAEAPHGERGRRVGSAVRDRVGKAERCVARADRGVGECGQPWSRGHRAGSRATRPCSRLHRGVAWNPPWSRRFFVALGVTFRIHFEGEHQRLLPVLSSSPTSKRWGPNHQISDAEPRPQRPSRAGCRALRQQSVSEIRRRADTGPILPWRPG